MEQIRQRGIASSELPRGGTFPTRANYSQSVQRPTLVRKTGGGGTEHVLRHLFLRTVRQGATGEQRDRTRKKNPLFSPFSLFFAKRGENEK